MRKAIRRQYPAFTDAPLRRLPSAGTQNHIWRLGEHHVVRAPMQHATIPALELENTWLPILADRLTLCVPQIVAKGKPDIGVQVPWVIAKWIEGSDGAYGPPASLMETADTLAVFIEELRAQPVPKKPPKGSRGGTLAPQDLRFRSALEEFKASDLWRKQDVQMVWQAGLDAAPYNGPPVWLHGDLMPANLIFRRERLVGIIDWGCLSTGDPAYDLIPAWFLFDAKARDRFFTHLNPPADMIARARARVVWQAVLALPYYQGTNSGILSQMSRGLEQALCRCP